MQKSGGGGVNEAGALFGTAAQLGLALPSKSKSTTSEKSVPEILSYSQATRNDFPLANPKVLKIIIDNFVICSFHIFGLSLYCL